MLVLSPTRELARQIYREAVRCLGLAPTPRRHRRGGGGSGAAGDFGGAGYAAEGALACQVVHGGVPRRSDVDAFRASAPDVLVATPGRLLDHLRNTRVPGRHGDDAGDDRTEENDLPFSSWLGSVRVLVVDEVDRLLDMGFRDDIAAILGSLPSTDRRQTLLLSATLPSEVRELMLRHVHPTNHVVVDCAGHGDPGAAMGASWGADNREPPATAASTIDQTYAVLPTHRMVSGVVELILHLLKPAGNSKTRQDRNKVLVFFPTTSQVIFYSCLLNHHLGRRAIEMHSEMPQERRGAASDAFRSAQFGGVMLTSDVSARGVDYPGVTHVVQVGAPRGRETYLHRLGRTGRAGRRGKGVLLVMEPERHCLDRDLSGLSIRQDERLQGLLDRPPPGRLRSDLLQVSHDIRTGQAEELVKHAEACYRSLLSYYYSRLAGSKRNDPARIDAAVDLANSFAYQSGLPDLPTLPVKLATQYGLLNHPRLNIDQRWALGTRFDVGARISPSAGDAGGGNRGGVPNAESAELWGHEEPVG
jgi:ATP-dependent RNA helicase MSS116